VEETLTRFWRLRRIGCAMRNAASERSASHIRASHYERTMHNNADEAPLFESRWLIISDACLGLAESAAESFLKRPGRDASCTDTAIFSATSINLRCGVAGCGFHFALVHRARHCGLEIRLLRRPPPMSFST
jgi:hypothetical protein